MFVFVLCLQSLVCILHSQAHFRWTSYISRAQEPHVDTVMAIAEISVLMLCSCLLNIPLFISCCSPNFMEEVCSWVLFRLNNTLGGCCILFCHLDRMVVFLSCSLTCVEPRIIHSSSSLGSRIILLTVIIKTTMVSQLEQSEVQPVILPHSPFLVRQLFC